MKHMYSSEIFCPIWENSVGEDDDFSVLYEKVIKNIDHKSLFLFLFEVSKIKSGCHDNGSTMRAMLQWTIFTLFYNFFSNLKFEDIPFMMTF